MHASIARGVGAGCVLIRLLHVDQSSSRLIRYRTFESSIYSHVAAGRSTKLDFLPHRTRAVRSGGPVAPALLRPLTFVHATPRAAHHQILYSRPFRVWAARVFDSVTVCIRSLLQSWSWTSGLRSRLSSGCPYPWSARRALSGPRRRSNNDNDSDSEGWRWEALQQTSESCLGISQAARWTSSRSSHGRHHHRGSRGQRAARLTSSRSSRRRRPCRGS